MSEYPINAHKKIEEWTKDPKLIGAPEQNNMPGFLVSMKSFVSKHSVITDSDMLTTLIDLLLVETDVTTGRSEGYSSEVRVAHWINEMSILHELGRAKYRAMRPIT